MSRRRLFADTNAPRDTVRGYSDAEHRRHDALLMQMLLRVAPMTALVNIGIGLLTAWLVYPVIGWSRHMAWPLGLSVMAFGYVVDSRRHLALPLERLARPAARWRYIGYALLLGMMYSGVAMFVFPVVGPDLQFLLGMTSCAAIPRRCAGDPACCAALPEARPVCAAPAAARRSGRHAESGRCDPPGCPRRRGMGNLAAVCCLERHAAGRHTGSRARDGRWLIGRAGSAALDLRQSTRRCLRYSQKFSRNLPLNAPVIAN